MSLRTILFLGPSFFRSLRKLPNLLYKVPKTFQFPRTSTGSTVTPKAGRFLGFFGNLKNTESLVGFIRRAVSAVSTHRRPNSLLRTYSGLAGSIRLRDQIILLPNHSYTTINKLSETQKSSWFHGFLSSFVRPRLPSILDQPSPLSPKALLGIGCNSAVWSADLTGLNGTNYELAVKVLYNYYANSSGSDVLGSSVNTTGVQSFDENLVDWILLRRQLERECTLRPSTGHPNIVPIVGHFLDRAPMSSVETKADSSDNLSITAVTESNNADEAGAGPVGRCTKRAPHNWVGAEAFPDGFDRHSFTYYLLMPRFDATLRDLLTGRWCPVERDMITLSDNQSDTSSPSFVIFSESSSRSFTSAHVSSSTSEFNRGFIRDHRMPLEVDDAVAVLAQLFDAVAELEHHGVAHRDIKLDNILVRLRTAVSTIGTSQTPDRRGGLEWLDDREVLATNTRFHVAVTDFGCAVRTKNVSPTQLPSHLSELFNRLLDTSGQERSRADASLSHSGNVALLAPEISCALQNESFHLTGSDYFKADLWAMATLAYPLFGVNNPFVNMTLNSVDYQESELPTLPQTTPGVVSWLLQQCLRRSPHSRPDADLVADVLHTWCLLRHAHRREKVVRARRTLQKGQDESFNIQMLYQILSDGVDMMSSSTAVTYLRTLLDVSWASDWLTGPARPPDGLRVSFYRRVTLGRFAHCLQIVYQAEAARATRMVDVVSASLSSPSFRDVTAY